MFAKERFLKPKMIPDTQRLNEPLFTLWQTRNYQYVTGFSMGPRGLCVRGKVLNSSPQKKAEAGPQPSAVKGPWRQREGRRAEKQAYPLALHPPPQD